MCPWLDLNRFLLLAECGELQGSGASIHPISLAIIAASSLQLPSGEGGSMTAMLQSHVVIGSGDCYKEYR